MKSTEKNEEFEKMVINTYFYKEIWEKFRYLVVNNENVVFAAFCTKLEARDYALRYKLKIVELDYEKLED